MWMDFGCEMSLVPELPETSQHFFYEVIRPGLADKRKRGKLFLKIFQNRDMNLKLASLPAHPPLSVAAFAFCVADPIGTCDESRRI
jgi:hypothetical protein